MVKMRFPHTITLDEETEKKAQEVLKDYSFVDIVKAGIKALSK
mgnify:FL=1